MLPELERHHDVLSPTLLGHAGGPPIDGQVTNASVADAVERAMDEARIETYEWAPNADWVELDGVGHCLQLDAPLETAQLIVGFTSR